MPQGDKWQIEEAQQAVCLPIHLRLNAIHIAPVMMLLPAYPVSAMAGLPA
jgi:hypothetical protein